jgi:Lrp/AsnC family leucine-responsive transcriptional regulator
VGQAIGLAQGHGELRNSEVYKCRMMRRPRQDFSLNLNVLPHNSLHMTHSTHDIDRIDIRILQALQVDGRLSNLKLADTVGLSPTAVLARTQRLQREGYILGYEARLNPLKLGRGMTVFVEVYLDRTTTNMFEEFKAAVQVRDEILECHMVAGGFDYLLKTRMADMVAYREFAGSVLWQLPGVRETRTYAVIDEVKCSTRLPL